MCNFPSYLRLHLNLEAYLRMCRRRCWPYAFTATQVIMRLMHDGCIWMRDWTPRPAQGSTVALRQRACLAMYVHMFRHAQATHIQCLSIRVRGSVPLPTMKCRACACLILLKVFVNWREDRPFLTVPPSSAFQLSFMRACMHAFLHACLRAVCFACSLQCCAHRVKAFCLPPRSVSPMYVCTHTCNQQA